MTARSAKAVDAVVGARIAVRRRALGLSQTALADGTMPYSGTLDCWRKVASTEGPMALYKGFMPGWLRLGPWQLVFWCSYEQLRLLSGLGGFK